MTTTTGVKHTPGPWKIAEERFGTGWTDGHEITASDGDIARTYRGRGHDTDAANARLISAAPELGEALKDIVNVFGTDIADHWGANELQKLCELLEKAGLQ